MKLNFRVGVFEGKPVIYYGEGSHITFRDCGCVGEFWPLFGEKISHQESEFTIRKAAMMACKMSKFRDKNGIFMRLSSDHVMTEFLGEVVIFTRGYKDWVVH